MKTLPVLSPINQADFYNELLLGTNTYILYCVVNNDKNAAKSEEEYG